MKQRISAALIATCTLLSLLAAAQEPEALPPADLARIAAQQIEARQAQQQSAPEGSGAGQNQADQPQAEPVQQPVRGEADPRFQAPFGLPHDDLARTARHIGAPRQQTPSPAITPVLTQHNDLSRTGQYLTETTLTPSNVNSTQFGKVFSYSVDGQIYAQPLYVPNVTIKGVSHNVVYVATENDSVYAFDADGKQSAPLWQVNYLNSTSSLSVVPVPCGTDGSTTDISCNIFPYYGITGTPVINLTASSPAAGTMYFIVRTQETPANGLPVYYQRLHAVDISTGNEISGSPVVVSGSFPGIGAGSDGTNVSYDPLADIQRAAITLANGNVYIAWAGAAHGWIMAYNATTLQQVAVFNSAPNYTLGGIWQTGNGLVADSSGNLYVSVGDTIFDASSVADNGSYSNDYGDTVLKFSPTLDVLDYFTPMDQACRGGDTQGDKDNDLDLGSAGPLLLPTQGGAAPDELLVIGKSGFGSTGSSCDTADVYLLNLNGPQGMGKYETGTGGTDNVIQELTDPPDLNLQPQGFWSSAAFWQGTENASGTSGTSYVYMAGTSALIGFNGGAPLDQYNINGVTGSATAKLSTSPVATSNLFEQGATPSVSSNGTTNGIVWAIERVDSLDQQPGDTPAVLWAYDATNVATMLYNSAEAGNNRDQGGCGNKFEVPTIANGRVYVGTQTQLDVYGLLSGQPPTQPWVSIPTPCYTWTDAVDVDTKSAPHTFTVTNSGTASLSITSMKMSGPNAGDFRLTNKCGITLLAGKSCEISVTFAPTLGVPEIAYVSITDNAAGSPHNIRVLGTGNGPSVVVNPGYLAYGRQNIGIATAAQNVTVANAGNIAVAISGISITGANAAQFSISSNNCPASLAVNASCTIGVTFDPQTGGQFSANLTIADNAGGPQLISLTGVGVQPYAVISPNQLSFGQIAVGGSSTSEPVTLTNEGNGTLIISSINFTGPNPGDFSQTNNCGTQLASQASCTINVTFKPTTQGTREAYLNVNDNDSSSSPQQVSLQGDGT
ncbi:MAG TPA: choice-of-anchor D domain-containing protein [Candidatus Binatia bacterium]|nr:choice-of-anchor D domain-containing protein [Candidatus Binatia bacterium]